MEIVSMKQQHTQILADLEKLCFSAPWSQTSLEDQVNNPRACFLTAVEGDQVLGYGGMHIAAGECYVDNIAVFHPCRGRGVGSAIIQALIDQAKKRDSAFLSLEVRPSNRAADLYKKFGFIEEGRRKNFYTDPVEDALILTLRFP